MMLSEWDGLAWNEFPRIATGTQMAFRLLTAHFRSARRLRFATQVSGGDRACVCNLGITMFRFFLNQTTSPIAYRARSAPISSRSGTRGPRDPKGRQRGAHARE